MTINRYMTDTRYHAIVSCFVRSATRLQEELRTDACIAITKMGIAVMRDLGIAAKPLSVRVSVCNPVLADHLGADGDVSDAPEGSFVVGVAHGVPPNDGSHGWNGHLVMRLTGTELIVDPTLGQFNRPDHGITLPLATVFDVGRDDEFRGDVTRHFDINGSLVVYEPNRGNTSFKKSPDWTLPTPAARAFFRDTVEEIGTAIRSVVDAGVTVSDDVQG